jgi:single-stranded DNA-binding protein
MSKAAIAIEGFISNDLEVRTAGTHRVVEVTVPHTPSKLVDGQWVNEDDKTVWFSATFWGDHADAVLDSVQKRSFVSVTGSVELEVYPKRDGTPGGKIKITSPVLSVVVRRPKRGEPVGARVAGPTVTDAAQEDCAQPTGYTELSDTETPF